MYLQTTSGSLNHSTESPCKGFEHKVGEFQRLYLVAYGLFINEQQARGLLLEITQLLKEVIQINNK